MNKQLWINGREWSSSLGVGQGAKNTWPKKNKMLRNAYKIFGPGGLFWINDLNDGIRTRDLDMSVEENIWTKEG
jgi:hypothetical protein